MSTTSQSWNIVPALSIPSASPETYLWYALLTQARHEKIVAQRLRERGVTVFLPLLTQVHRWSDRKKIVELPLFSCYVFAKLPPTSEGRLIALRIDGVYSLVGRMREGTPIPNEQIEAVRRVIEDRLPWHAHTFLKIGQRVRVRSGALEGVEGILVSRQGESTLIVSIDAIQRSLAVRIEGYDVEPA
jgi:transcription antitermination factor NusG